jgi:hypothetical protein
MMGRAAKVYRLGTDDVIATGYIVGKAQMRSGALKLCVAGALEPESEAFGEWYFQEQVEVDGSVPPRAAPRHEDDACKP